MAIESYFLQFSLGRQFNNGANKPVTEMLCGEYPIFVLPTRSAEALQAFIEEFMELEDRVDKAGHKLACLIHELTEPGRWESADAKHWDKKEKASQP